MQTQARSRAVLMTAIGVSLIGSIGGLGVASAQSIGDKVLGRWSDGWYVAKLIEKSAANARVIWDDGSENVLPLSSIRPITWTVGSRVACNWKHKGAYYPGVITSKNNDVIEIRYDDGDRENTLIDRCRVPL